MIGDKVRIQTDNFNAVEGYITRVDDMGRLYGTWGKRAIIPAFDEYEIIADSSEIERMRESIDFMPKLREITRELLDVPIKTSDLSPSIIEHPCFESGLIDIGGKIVNILESDKNLKKAKDILIEQIEAAEMPKNLMAIIRGPYRLIWLRQCERFLTKKEYSRLLADAWIDSTTKETDAFDKAEKRYVMNASEYKQYRNLPKKKTLYKSGPCWTDKKNGAEKKVFPREKIYAVFDRTNEHLYAVKF